MKKIIIVILILSGCTGVIASSVKISEFAKSENYIDLIWTVILLGGSFVSFYFLRKKIK